MTIAHNRILIVDDNPGDIELIRIAFEMAHIPVIIESVSDGIEAMQKLSLAVKEKNLPTMVILDLNMPRANGFEVLDYMCVKHLNNKVPVVVLTTSRQEEDHRRCLSLGAKAMCSKPESLVDLQGLINNFSFYFNKSNKVDDRA